MLPVRDQRIARRARVEVLVVDEHELEHGQVRVRHGGAKLARSTARSIVATASRSRSYEATAQILIVPLSQDNQIYFGTGLLRDAGAPSLTAASAAQVLHSEDIGRATAQAIGHGQTASSVLNRVAVRPTLETNVLAVTASAASRVAATDLAATYVKALVGVPPSSSQIA